MTEPAQRLPYPGLRAFNKDEADLFFGRDAAVNDLILRLSRTRFLAVLGASGTGKSSLVRTGMLDGLELGLHPAGANWRFCDMAPGGQPIRNLARGLMGVVAEDGGGRIDDDEVETLEWFLRRGPRSLVEWVEEGHLPAETQLLVLVDQFEELFRFAGYDEREEAEAFVKLLIQASREPDSRIHVVITMRSEYLGACVLIPDLAETINAGSYLTPRMDREGCRMAIVGPARMFGADVEPALLNTLLNDLERFAPFDREDGPGDQIRTLSRRADQLPVMQHVLNRVWLAEAEAEGGRTLRLSTYEDLGGLGGALDRHGRAVLDALGADRAADCQRIFRALVDGPTIATARRRPLSFEDLLRETGIAEEDAREILDAFRGPDVNFLRPPTSVPLTAGTIIDISHESLIRQWGKLSDWLAREAQGAAVIRRVAEAKERHERGEGDLLSGLDLANIDTWWREDAPSADWAQRYVDDFEGLESYLRRSRETEAESQSRRLTRVRKERNRLRLFAATTSVIAIAALAFFWDARRQRDAAVDLRAAADRSASEAVALQAAAEASEADMLAATEALAIDLVELLETDDTIPIAAKYDLIRNAEAAFATLSASRGNDPGFVAQRARFLLAGHDALGAGGYWTEAADYGEQLHALMLAPPSGWEPDAEFRLRSAVSLAEHHRMAGRKESAEQWLRTARDRFELTDPEAADHLADAARIHAAESRLATQWFLYERQLDAHGAAWALFEAAHGDLTGERGERLRQQDPKSFDARRMALVELAATIIETSDAASGTVVQIDADDRFGLDYPDLTARSQMALDFLEPVEGLPDRILATARFDHLTILGRASNDNDPAAPEAVEHMHRALEIAENLSAADPTNRQYRVLLLEALIRRADYATDAGQFAQADADLRAAADLLLALRLDGVSWVERVNWEPWLHYYRWNLEFHRGGAEAAERHAHARLAAAVDSLEPAGGRDPQSIARLPVILSYVELHMLVRDLLPFDKVAGGIESAFAAMPLDGAAAAEPYFWLAQRQYIHDQLVMAGPGKVGEERWEEAYSEGYEEATMLLDLAPGNYRAINYQIRFRWSAASAAKLEGDLDESLRLYRSAYDIALGAASSDRLRASEFNLLIENAAKLLRNIVGFGPELFAAEDLVRLERLLRDHLARPDSATAVQNTKGQFDALRSELDALKTEIEAAEAVSGAPSPRRIDRAIGTLDKIVAASATRAPVPSVEPETAEAAEEMRAQLRSLHIDGDLIEENVAYWVRPPLLEGVWQTLEGQAFDEMIGTLAPTSYDADDISFIRTVDLPFYDTGRMVEFQVGTGDRARIFAYLVFEDGKIYRLDGTSPAIHEANAVQSVRLDTSDRVAAYIRFFMHYVNASGGSFSIVESASQIPFSDGADREDFARAQRVMRPFVIWEDPQDKSRWQASGTIYYDRALSHALLRIEPTGMIEMLDDNQIVEDLDASIIRISDRESGVRLGGEAAGLTIDHERLGLARHDTDAERAVTAIRRSVALRADAAGSLRRDYVTPLLDATFDEVVETPGTARNSVSYELLLADRDPELALSLAKLARRDFPDDPYIADTYGWALLKTGQVDAAIEVLEASYAEVSEEVEIMAHLAQAYRIAGRTEEARDLIRTARAFRHDAFWADFLAREEALLD